MSWGQDFLSGNSSSKPQSSGQNPFGGILQALSGPLRTTAEGVIDWGRLASAGANAVTGGKVGAPITGQEQPTFISPQEQQNAAQNATNPNPLENSAVQTALGDVGYVDVPMGLKNLATKAPSAVKLLSKGGVGSAINSKVEQATAKGLTDTWHDFRTELSNEVAKRLGNEKKYQDILDAKINPESPASLDSNPTITPNKLLDIRRQAANREPQGIFAKFGGKNAAAQVDEIIRDVASKRVKDIAGTGKLDKAYSLYSKFGSPARMAANIGASALTPDFIKKNIPGDAGGEVGLLTLLEKLIK